MADDIQCQLVAVCQTAAFNRWLGLEIVKAEAGEVEIAMPWRDEAGQYSGYLHAGVIGGLIDTVCGFAAASVAGPVLAAHFSVNCLAPAVGVRFRARASVVRSGRRQIFTRGELFAIDAAGAEKLVATGETLLMRRD